MAREKNYSKKLKSYFNSYVTFDDSAKGKIIGKKEVGLSWPS